jgi:hypothetical protein
VGRPFALVVAAAVASGLLSGCAGQVASARDAPAAERIYAAAEARVEQGAHGEGALLLRHALLQLPSDASADELRHALILRIAYVEMLAWSSSGNRVHLEDAQRMLLRYLELHEAMFGDQEPLRVARGDVYEILYEVELRLDDAQSPKSSDPGSSAAAPVVAEAAASVTSAERLPVASTEESTPRRKARAADHDATAPDKDVRVVRVRSRQQPDVNDPETRRVMKSAFSNPEAFMVLTRAGVVEAHGPRPLVRLAGPPRSIEGDSFDERRHARTLGRTLMRAARSELRECLAGAFARQPISSAESTVELSIHPDGTVTGVRIVDGGLIDGLGDVCVIERLQATQVEDPQLLAAARVQLPLEFIYQGAVMIHEATGQSPPSTPFDIIPQTSTADPGYSDPKPGLRPVR